MELNDIKIFMELYRSKSITKTAEFLHYTQSNISTRLLKLEKEFHGTFFLRNRSGLEILPYGERFYNHALKIEESLKSLYQEFQSENTDIHIGSTQLLSRLYFPRLYEISSQYTMHTAPVKKLNREFNNQTYEAIITHTRLIPEKGVFEIRNSESLIWTGSSSFNFTTPDNSPVIVSRDKLCPLRILTFQLLNHEKNKISIIEVDTLDLMISLLLSTRALALLPETLIKENHPLKALSSLTPAILPVYGYCRSKKEKDSLEELFYQ